MNRGLKWLTRSLAIGLAVLPQLVNAGKGAWPQIDVSIAVSVTPSQFQPGDRGTVTLALHNAGPTAAGVAQPGPSGDQFANYVIGPGFRLPTTWDWGPFDILWSTVNGCVATYDVAGPGPPPDFFFALVFQFYFEVIPPEESRVCTFDIQFLPKPFETFETRWRYTISAAQEDTDPSNNQVFYTIVAGEPAAPPAPVPALSRWASVGAGIGLIALAYACRRRFGNN